MPADRIATLARHCMRAFEIPGLALAWVQNGSPPHVQCHGIRALGLPDPVDTHTQFAVASISKAFLSACLARLVDDGVIRWDDPVSAHLPVFRMQAETTTRLMTVLDLLVHRSGLGPGAGDLMVFPRSDHSAEDVLHAFRFLKPVGGFRAGYAYQSCLYIVAGLLVREVSGMDWDAFVTSRIFEPLRMHQSVSNPTKVDPANRAGRHVRLGPPAIGMGELVIFEPDEPAMLGPAGGINMSIGDAIPWLRVQLALGELEGGGRLWSAARAKEMWTPHTLIASGPGPSPEHPERSVMQAYALGWGLSDFRGQRMLTHGGGLAGQASRVTLLPEQGIGLAIFANSGDSDAVSALRYALLDELLDMPSLDWFRPALDAREHAATEMLRLVGKGDFPSPSGGPSLRLDRYAGRYRDPWYGDVLVSHAENALTLRFTRTPALVSALEPHGHDTFRTRFARGSGEDAIAAFVIERGRAVRIAMTALSPLADFSFDYHDLDLRRVSDT